MVTFIQPFTDVLVIKQREPATKRRSLRESSHLKVPTWDNASVRAHTRLSSLSLSAWTTSAKVRRFD